MAVAASVAMVLFPPYLGLHGTEWAFIATGPEWSRQLSAMGEGMGLKPELHWTVLLAQLGGLWAVALGARWVLRTARRSDA